MSYLLIMLPKKSFLNVTLYDLRRDVTFHAAATDAQMIAQFLANGAS